MKTPQEYLLVTEGEHVKDGTVFSNLDWGKEEARRSVEVSRLRQIIYKLVPVYEVDIKVTYEFPIKDYTQS